MSNVVDADERIYGEVGVLTFQLEQTYVADGEREAISAPSTMIFRRITDEWKMILFHSVPLPD